MVLLGLGVSVWVWVVAALKIPMCCQGRCWRAAGMLLLLLLLLLVRAAGGPGSALGQGQSKGRRRAGRQTGDRQLPPLAAAAECRRRCRCRCRPWLLPLLLLWSSMCPRSIHTRRRERRVVASMIGSRPDRDRLCVGCGHVGEASGKPLDGSLGRDARWMHTHTAKQPSQVVNAKQPAKIPRRLASSSGLRKMMGCVLLEAFPS